MNENQFAEYRVEYRTQYGDNHEWQPRPDIHGTMADAVAELSHISDCRGFEFRIVKRLITTWEVVE